MKIISLEAENVKCLKAISIKPDGSLVVIGGENGNGKSSILDSIEYALGGSKHIPTKPIREGQEKARIVLDLGEMQVIRTFTQNGTNLVVKSKEGATFASPQAMLDKIVGDLSFDPLEFCRMDSKKRLETLKRVIGLDFTDLDKKRTETFNKRADVNRRGKELKAKTEGVVEYKDVAEKELSVSELSVRLTDAINKNQKLDEAKRCLDHNKSRLTKIDEQIKRLTEEKSMVESTITKEEFTIKNIKRIDLSEIQDKINSAEETNRKIRSNLDKKKLEAELQTMRDQSEAMSVALKNIDETKQQMVENAKFPIKGLSFGEDEVLLNGIPFDQISQGEKIKISTAMGLVLNPTLKILLIRDGSLLDTKNLEIVAKMAAKVDAQVWIERVGKGKECQLIIQDGEIIND